MTNIFRQAKILLDKKDSGAQLTEEERRLINTAIIPLMVNTNGFFPDDITIAEGLEELARLVEQATVVRRSHNEETPPPQKSNTGRDTKRAKRRKRLLVAKT